MRRTRNAPGQPDSAPSSCLSQSSVLAKRLFTTRTTQTPPARASTLNSVAIGGEPGAQPSASLANSRGGSQAVTTECDSMPGPKVNLTATGLPPCSSNSAGTNQAEIPGPVAMACQTSSGVPGTSISTWIEWRPDGSFFTLMMSPWDWISAAEGSAFRARVRSHTGSNPRTTPQKIAGTSNSTSQATIASLASTSLLKT